MSPQTDRRRKGRFEAPKRKTARRITGGVLALVILLLSFCRAGAEGFKLLGWADVFIGGGKMLVYGNVDKVDMGDAVPDIPIYSEVPSSEPEGDYVLWLDDGTTVVYQGHRYELNRHLTTVLFLGVDDTIEESHTVGKGGQSDVILLIAMDTVTGQTTILNIPRDAYAQVDLYSVGGIYLGTDYVQITLAYAYGDGRHSSCENAALSVSRLLYGLPISSYLALDMNGIQAANETIGGVTVNSLIDTKMPDGTELHKGDLIELHGKNLDHYIRTRGQDLEANARRMERQKQYVTEFSKLAVAKSKQSISYPVDLFSTLAPYMVTNLDISDVTFLSSTFLSHKAAYNFRDLHGSFDKLNGSTVCYLDEMDLFEAILQIFYTQVD